MFRSLITSRYVGLSAVFWVFLDKLQSCLKKKKRRKKLLLNLKCQIWSSFFLHFKWGRLSEATEDKLSCLQSQGHPSLTRCPSSHNPTPVSFSLSSSSYMRASRGLARKEAMEGQAMQSGTCGLSGFNKALFLLTPAKASHSQGWHIAQLKEWRVCVRECVYRCLFVCVCVSALWTNISNWAINHCANRHFNLVETGLHGWETVIAVQFVTVDTGIDIFIHIQNMHICYHQLKRGEMQMSP